MMHAKPPFVIGIAGLGTVGSAVVGLLRDNADSITARAGRNIVVRAVSARDRARDRGVKLTEYLWVDNVMDLAVMPGLDAVVEVIGGTDTARVLVESALMHDISVVTANKALLAVHGYDLSMLAERNGVALAWEAAVAGGIPIIKTLREGLAGNRVHGVHGILNGTCNYILSRMEAEGAEFTDILADAQTHGYAEADPTFDVEGIDAGHKLALLVALAFGTVPDFSALAITGISRVSATDIRCAGELGYRIRLIGMARRERDGRIAHSVEPCLVRMGSALASVVGVLNAVMVDADPLGISLSVGRGAGAGPTASAVVADIIDLARGHRVPTFGVATQDLEEAQWCDKGETRARFYLRLSVVDRSGVIAAISAILRDCAISIESLLQHGRDPQGGAVTLVMTTHEALRAAMDRACAQMAALDVVLDTPQVLRIEEE